MPSIRKRIGYLPSEKIQKLIFKLATKEQLSQSKMVGVLVEEALRARGVFDLKKNYYYTNTIHTDESNVNTSYKYNDVDELISDKGISYNIKHHKYNPDIVYTESNIASNKELFEQFKKFMLFQKLIEKK